MNGVSKTRDLFGRLDQLGIEWLSDQLIVGRSLRSIAMELGASPAGVLKWIDREPGRMREYQLARQAQADCLIDQLLELADSPVPVDDQGRTDAAAVNQLRLRVDTRKWIASKFRPGMYSDRVQVESVTPPGRDQKPEEVIERITALLAAHGMRITVSEQSGIPAVHG